MDDLIERLRRVAQQMYGWTAGNPPFTSWAELVDEAADRLESYEEAE